MKKIVLMLLAAVFITACGKDKGFEPVNKDLIVFHSTTFKSDVILTEVMVNIGFGVMIPKTVKKYEVIRFKENGKLEFFTVDDNNKISLGLILQGSYSLAYPKITKIQTLGNKQTETVIQKTDNLSFILDGLTYTSSLDSYTK